MILGYLQAFNSVEFKVIIFLLLTVMTILTYWLIQKLILSKLVEVKKIPLDITNLLKIGLKIISAAMVLYFAIVLFQIPLDSIFGLSALLGAIVSFSSTQIMTNFIAGLYLLFTHPFGVDDFIALSEEVKGQVVEISLNYTKIRTVNDIYHLIPNKHFLSTNIFTYTQKLKRRIGSLEATDTNKSRIKEIRKFAYNLLEEEVVRYTFTWGAPIGNLKETKRKFQEVCDIYAGVFGYKPEFFLYTIDYRMQFKFIIITHSSDILLENLREFRNEIISRIH